jgi:clorobiocin biosynthesis protein CloN5
VTGPESSLSLREEPGQRSSRGQKVSKEEVSAELLDFIRNKFLGGDPQGELTASTPLLEWGVLDSLNTAVLLTHIRDDLGVTIPPVKVSSRFFKDVDSISAMICDLTVAATK